MKRVLLFVLVGAFSLCSQAAPNAAMPVRANDAISIPAQPYSMFPQDWDVYEGKYYLSNGDNMVLHRRGLRMYAEVTGRPQTQLVAAAPNVFVAVDRQLKMTLVDQGFGNITGELVMAVPGQSLQQSKTITGRVDHLSGGQ